MKGLFPSPIGVVSIDEHASRSTSFWVLVVVHLPLLGLKRLLDSFWISWGSASGCWAWRYVQQLHHLHCSRSWCSTSVNADCRWRYHPWGSFYWRERLLSRSRLGLVYLVQIELAAVARAFNKVLGRGRRFTVIDSWCRPRYHEDGNYGQGYSDNHNFWRPKGLFSSSHGLLSVFKRPVMQAQGRNYSQFTKESALILYQQCFFF